MKSGQRLGKNKRTIFLVPMADNLSPRVKNALIEQDICHRESEFSSLLKIVREKLKKVVFADSSYTTVMLTGSGTAALEAALSAVATKGQIAILNNGLYGERLVEIAKTYRLRVREIISDNRLLPDLGRLEEIIRTQRVKYVACVHNETSTGLLNPVKEIGRLCKKYQKIFLVDAISSIASEKINVVQDNIHFLMASSNKGLQGPEGLSFVIAKKRALRKTENYPRRNYYLNLLQEYRHQERGQSRFTPAVRVFSALNEALDELDEEGLDYRIARSHRLSQLVRQGLKALGFRFALDEKLMSNTVTLVNLPPGTDYLWLHNRLKEKGFVIYSGVENIKERTFRICNVGEIYPSDIRLFLKALKGVLDERNKDQMRCRTIFKRKD